MHYHVFLHNWHVVASYIWCSEIFRASSQVGCDRSFFAIIRSYLNKLLYFKIYVFFTWNRKGLITDGMFSRCRNPNYLGEIFIYGAFAGTRLKPLGWVFDENPGFCSTLHKTELKRIFSRNDWKECSWFKHNKQ